MGETIKVACIQMECESGIVKANLEKAGGISISET